MPDPRRRTALAATAGLLAAPALAQAVQAAESAASAVPVREPRVQVRTRDGTPLHVVDWAGRGRPVVFVHAWGLSSAIWEYPMAALAEAGHRVVAFDRRGHGLSPDPGTGYDYDTLADDLAAVMGALGLHDAVLVGHSMGCAEIAACLGRHGAGRIARAVFVSVPGPAPGNAPVDAFLDGLRSDRPGFLAASLPLFTGRADAAPKPLDRWVLATFMQTSPRAMRECLRLAMTSPLGPLLPAVRCPTLLIHGGRDALNPLESTGAKTARAIPGARLLVVDDAPHGLVVTHHRRLTAELLAFAAQT